MSIQQHKAEGRKEDSGQLMYIAHQYKALRKSCLGKADRTSTFLLAFFCARHHTSMAVLQWYKNKPFAETPVAKNKNTEDITRFNNKNTALSPSAQASKTAFSTTTALLSNCRKLCDTSATLLRNIFPKLQNRTMQPS